MSKIEELRKKLDEIQMLIGIEMKKREEVECPFEEGDIYFILGNDGNIIEEQWEEYDYEIDGWFQGNVFSTEKEAILGRDRRILLTKFKSFRDKCNGDWKADFTAHNRDKYALFFNRHHDAFFVEASATFNHFNLFGYFKNEVDAELAIELFGDEIKRLWVEVTE